MRFKVDFDALHSAVAVRTGLTTAQLAPIAHHVRGCPRGNTQARRARQAIQYVLNRKARLSLKSIGTRLGRDHTSIRYNVQRFRELLERRDPQAIALYRTVIRCWLLQVHDQRAQLRAVEAQIKVLASKPRRKQDIIDRDAQHYKVQAATGIIETCQII